MTICTWFINCRVLNTVFPLFLNFPYFYFYFPFFYFYFVFLYFCIFLAQSLLRSNFLFLFFYEFELYAFWIKYEKSIWGKGISFLSAMNNDKKVITCWRRTWRNHKNTRENIIYRIKSLYTFNKFWVRRMAGILL